MIRLFIRLSMIAAGWYLVLPALTHAAECSVTVGLAHEANVSGIVVDVDYSGGSASLVGEADAVHCESEVPGAVVTFNNEGDASFLTAALMRVEGFSGPALFTCTATGDVTLDSFRVATNDAADPELATIVPLPRTIVTSIQCTDGRSTTAAPVEVEYCDVTFTAHTEQPTSGLVFEADYSAAPGQPAGSSDAVKCKTVVGDGLGAYNDEEETSTLVAALIQVAGFQGSTDLSTCRFETDVELVANDLSVIVTDATGPKGETIDPDPTVTVGQITCGAGTPEATGGEPGAPDTGDCDGPYEVTVSMGGHELVGAIQLAISYASAPGGFVGSGEHVECTTAPGLGVLASFNDKESSKKLLAGFVSTAGFRGPTALVTCSFESGGTVPRASDFVITITDVARPDASDVAVVPTVSVSSIASASGDPACGGLTCGDGVVDGNDACDDGNSSNSDGCLNDCTVARCGDGYIQTDIEECDNGSNNTDTLGAACRSDCTLAQCGDSDGSGALTATDARRILNHSIGLSGGCSLSLCDVNGTGTVTATDARLVLNASVGLEVVLDCSLGLVFTLDTEVTLGALQVVVDYSATGSGFVGAGEEVGCVSLLGNTALVGFNNDVASQQLNFGIAGIPAIAGPQPIVACVFYQNGEDVALDDFVIDVVDASTPTAEPVDGVTVSVGK